MSDIQRFNKQKCVKLVWLLLATKNLHMVSLVVSPNIVALIKRKEKLTSEESYVNS